ncbi:uncharacterized protein LOC128274144 [Anopheles cruzii]|uniref:uncharacterized protein LOC128274144 n=1 Tax=Anopheles cruzii TaxID=68878 RepID=UPI0022EC5312|nr:uncharacterized protein LOC128274144 [Anopheles cruzii]
MPLAVEGNYCEPESAAAMTETPGKKRKRNAETNPFLNFADQTFSISSSTPIRNRQIDGSAFENPSFRGCNKENYNIFSDSCMEVKSIADLAASSAVNRPASVSVGTEANPFEVIRKPPKKKKKHHDGAGLEESCFENPCLNLAAADKKPLNPFEVLRDGEECKRKEAEDMSRCFVNSALSIRDRPETGERLNPFEIVRARQAEAKETAGPPAQELAGIENPALELPTYAIAVPFTPSLKHRINFHELPPGALTPCQLLANMVVCSPIPSRQSATDVPEERDTPRRNATVTLAKRRSLSVINEESDIGEKLDCYQLELENSMNEARVRKELASEATPGAYSGAAHLRRSVRRSLMDVKHISNLSQKLRELADCDEGDVTNLEPDTEDEDKENKQPAEEKETLKKAVEEEQVPTTAVVPEEKTEQETDQTDAATSALERQEANQITFTITKETIVREEIRIDVSNPDVQFEEVDDFEDEEQDVELLNNPAPFQRAYRKKEPAPVCDEFKCPTNIPDGREGGAGKSHKVRDVIRRSFRRLIPRHQSVAIPPEGHEKAKETEAKQSGAEGAHGHGLISSIRHSLRRRHPKAPSSAESEGDRKPSEAEAAVDSALEMSIIAEQPRTVFRQPSLEQYTPIAAAPSGGATLRSSFRRSTKDIGKQMMKSVFRKQTASGDLATENGQRVGPLV